MNQKILFTSGMDSDTAPEYMGPANARKRINVRVLSSDNDQIGAQETVLGNTLVSYALPAGDNVVIGSKEDLPTKKIYYFVWNSNDSHSILEFDYVFQTIKLVLQEAVAPPYYLNFDRAHLITGINVVELDATNHLLYWTDNYVKFDDPNVYNEPKKLNIEKAVKFSAGDFINGYPSPFEPRFITRIKQPPPYAPTYAWSVEPLQKINFFSKKFFTFKVQFVYDDNEVSAWSPISAYEFPVTQNMGGSGEDLTYTDNKITITAPTGSGIVTRIRIAAKQLGLTDFSLIADLSKSIIGIPSDSTYDFDFFNDGNYVQLEINESIKLYDNVPQRSQAQEIIEGQRLVDGLVTENFDPVDADMRFPLSYELLDIPSNPHFVNKSYLKSGGAYKQGIVYYDEFGNRSGLSNTVNGKTTELIGDVYGTTLFIPFLTDPLYMAPHGIPNEDMAYIPVVNSEIYHRPPSWAKRYQIVRSKNEAIARYIQFVGQTVTYLDANKAATTTPADYVYVVIDISNITGRYLIENPNSTLVYDWVKGDRIRFIANYKPDPTSFSYTEIEPFFSFNDSEIIGWNQAFPSVMIKLDSTIPTVLTAGVLFEIYTPAKNVINNNELTFEITEEGEVATDTNGDLIHQAAIANQSFVPMISNYSAGAFLQFYFCIVPIGHGLTLGRKVKIVGAGWSIYGTVVFVFGAGNQVEIDTTGFTLVGTHTTGGGTIIASAEAIMSGGDCFRRYCDMPWADTLGFVYRLYQFIEVSSASNLFVSNADDYGRPNRIDPLIKRVTRQSTIFYSENFIPETAINGLSSVFDTSFETYEQKYGGIYKLFSKDHLLKVYQELKVGRLPYGQVVLNSTTGASLVGQSADVLPSVMEYYDGEFGIGRNPESFANYGPADYFIDINRGVVLRLSLDGLTPISDIANMHNYFTDKCRLLVETNEPVQIFGVFDVKFSEYVISFATVVNGGFPPTIIPPETLAWNERANQWSTYYTYHPDYMCSMNTGIVSFKDGQFYIHNTNTAHGTFYGVQSPAEFWVICNGAGVPASPVNNYQSSPARSNQKVLQAISEESNAAWEVYEVTTPNNQLTNLLETDFQEIENNQYAPVLRDVNTPNVAIPIIEGDVMRDRTFFAKFRYNPTDYNRIFAVNFSYIISNLSNR